MFTGNAGEVLQKLIKGIPGFQIIDESLDRHAGAGKAGMPLSRSGDIVINGSGTSILLSPFVVAGLPCSSVPRPQ